MFNHPISVLIDPDLAYFAGLTYGDGYAEYGEVRIVTASTEFKIAIEALVSRIARTYSATWNSRHRPSKISERGVWHISLNSTLIRRSLFLENHSPSYDAMHKIAVESEFAGHFQAGLTDAEGTLIPEARIDSPHGRIFAITNNDRRLLGIARLSLVYRLRLEPTSISIRVSKKRFSKHVIHGQTLATDRNLYVLEVLSGAKRKWLQRVGSLLRHPEKRRLAERLLATYQ